MAESDHDVDLDNCQQRAVGTAELRTCVFGDADRPTKTVAVVGNSHAVRLIPALDLYGKSHHWKILLAARTNCLGVLPVAVAGGQDAKCAAWSKNVLAELTRQRVDLVLFASHADSASYLTGSTAPDPSIVASTSEAIDANWGAYRRAGVRILVAGDVPGTRPDEAPQCIAASSEHADPCALPRAEVDHPNFLGDLAQRRPDLVTYHNLSDALCSDSKCHALIGGLIVYSDSHHLTTSFSWSMADYLGDKVAGSLP